MSEENGFIAKYGKATFKEPSDLKPVEFREHFEDGDLNLMVLFWRNQAHSIIVGRKDGQRLTTEDVANALKTYSDGKEWVVVASSADGHSKDWKRDGASAFLLDSRASDSAAGLPINNFVVTTDDLHAEMERSEP